MGTFNVIQVQELTPATLHESKMRAAKFLIALGNRTDLCERLAAQGYTQADHLEGWTLLAKAGGSEVTVAPPKRTTAAAAVRELDAWDELGFRKAHSALFRAFPEQVEFLFQGLTSTQGEGAILGVIKFLDRVDALEKGRSPATQDADKKAVDTLAARGIDMAERTRLRALIDVAQSAPVAPAAPAPTPATVHEEDLRALYAWYVQWSEIARLVIKPRAEQILLGIAKRRRGKTVSTGASAQPAGASVVAPATSPNAPAQPVMRVAANG